MNRSDISSSDMEKIHNIIDVTGRVPPANDLEIAARDIQGWKWITVVLAIQSSTFLFAMGNTITASCQVEIVRGFQAVNKLSWVGVGLVMRASATVLLWGKIFFYINTKWTYIISVAIFEI
ncbi:efflux pump antibiotic resistance protein [Penicillium soppii]|jgi:hypothetical protein|uniref:efflux pump antibiotic resistance protein n=1 Tax=Penicillium soppii TaxID=69789 RepID=UPI0025499133|nr:efflux pump antibiotic resistance protein [Penicillium soppii]KAJ5860148.1 efflux pump antibiotic resistance protein [Penicillium soppii]